MILEGNRVSIQLVRRKPHLDPYLEVTLEQSESLLPGSWAEADFNAYKSSDQSNLPDGKSPDLSDFERVEFVVFYNPGTMPDEVFFRVVVSMAE